MYKKILAIIICISIAAFSVYTFAQEGSNLGLSVFVPEQGGTGTGTAPSLGEVLVGQSDGTYSPQATSTLGISGGSGTFLGLTDTNVSALNQGDIFYVNGSSEIVDLAAGTNGQVLKLASGIPSWGTDLQGSGGAGLWATTTDSLAQYPSDTSRVVLVGNNATSTTGNILEVLGNSLFRGTIDVYDTLTVGATATTTISGDGTIQTGGALTLGGNLLAGGNDITSLGDILFQTGATGGTLQTGTSNADKFQLQGYDVDDTTYINVFQIDAGNTVTAEFNENAADLDIRFEGTGDTHLLFTDASANNVGVGTSSPYAKLSVVGETVASHFTATTTNTNTFPNTSITKLVNLTSNGFVKTSGGDGTLSVDTTTYTPTTRQLTIAGTANQITSSAGAQDLSADRTWTLSLPDHVIFPSSFQAALASTTQATSTNHTITGNLITPQTSAMLTVDGNGLVGEYAGTSCTNQFVRSLSVLGAATCETVQNTDLANSTISGVALGSNLENLTATDSTLTFSGAYNGGTARTVGINLANPNAWTGLQSFLNASSTLFSNFGTAYFGGTATTTIDSAGNVNFGGNIVIGGDTINEFAGTGLTVTGNSLTADLGTSVDLSSEVTGTLPVANGGTGATTLTDGGILLGSGTGAITALAALSDGFVIVGDGATDPTTIQLLTAAAGTVRHEVGGLEADVSAFDGSVFITGGATSATTTTISWDKTVSAASTTAWDASSIFAGGATSTLKSSTYKAVDVIAASGHIASGTSLQCAISNGSATSTVTLTTTEQQFDITDITIAGEYYFACGEGVGNPDDMVVNWYGTYAY